MDRPAHFDADAGLSLAAGTICRAMALCILWRVGAGRARTERVFEAKGVSASLRGCRIFRQALCAGAGLEAGPGMAAGGCD
ncbi:hypothetical protein [Pseudotabrizicola sp.]|uniref:hypothetical protein n=1 Tax=Pseudotabrizicola sp. TaxID=2939647 RepID=UPI00271EE08D|nr:hypothetical protein [Pseudotabrizicola sp.]MDO8883765.1 hypothetical protein [Pseudotabrizicola sp.]